ncbi:MAG: arsenate reductase ArsC [Candidatus Riflebacteria bacterium]|nr:arsenate reductase ArsC [Candidatus Riflebacteria bacterium]
MKNRLLFLCTGNSCRSQMAEGLTRFYWPDLFEVHSAGIEAHGLNPKAVQVMREMNIDISQHQSKELRNLPSLSFDFVITVCNNANEACPIFPGNTKKFHHDFNDPPKLAKTAKSQEEILLCYRQVRDQISEFVKNLPEFLKIRSS